ncbi:MAG: hypothetical protein A2Y10_16320 [Planctomycetes bacterium GWF2_41_51]|nr:MAG: hypothetical protein A2Y10_16320 [Planctomycetes bacterium GWF2_41_51]
MDGTIEAWGWNEHGQCNIPLPNSGFIAVEAGNCHSLGIKSNGSIVAWGLNSWQQCNVPTPNTGFVAVAGGGYHSVGLKQDGTIIVWGGNETHRTVPLPNSGFVAVAAGDSFSLALRSDGSIAAWGYNNYGEFDVPSPNANFKAIAAGYNFCMGLKQDGSVVAWGYNFSGQCTVPSPNQGFIAIAAGLSQGLGIVSYSQNLLVGSGTENDPYLITSLADFNKFSTDESYWAENVHTKLVCDINLVGRTYTEAVIAPDADNSNETIFDGTAFNGIFDGNGHKILNLIIDNDGAKNGFLGLFGRINSEAKVKNLVLEKMYILSSSTAGTCYIGGLCGENSGLLSNCVVNGTVTGNYSAYVGGLAGQNSYGNIQFCNSNTNVTAGDGCVFIGGLVGVNVEGDIINCSAVNNVTTGDVTSYIGGLAGTNLVFTENAGNAFSNINNCYATGNVTGGSDSEDIGGLVGLNYGQGAGIANSYATGVVKGQTSSYCLGGLCGYNRNADIIKCYSSGNVQTGNYLGALCGYHIDSSAIIENSFWNTETSGLSVGYNLSSSSPGTISNVYGKTTEQMKTISTFLGVGWDFIDETANGSDDIWRMCTDGQDYPRFFWDFTAGDFTCPDGVNFKDFAALASVWLSESGDSNWRQRYDISEPNDSKIDMSDLMVFCENWLLIPNDLIAYWKMDEGSGATVSDSSNNNHNGTIYGATWTEGISGNALSFDGGNDYISIPYNPDFAYTIGQDRLTISAWIYPRDKDDTSPGAIYSDRAAGNGVLAVVMKITSGKFIVGGWSPSALGYNIESPVTANNQWYFMTIVFDSGFARLYIDGDLKSSISLAGVSLTNGGTGMMLGKHQGGWSNFFNGKIDEVCIYKKALSQSEIINLMNH